MGMKTQQPSTCPLDDGRSPLVVAVAVTTDPSPLTPTLGKTLIILTLDPPIY